MISRAANKTPLQDTYYSHRRRRHYHHRCRQRPCRAHITPARHHGRTSTRYGCLQYIYYHMNQHKLTPSSITPLAQTRSLRYVRSSTRCRRRSEREAKGGETRMTTLRHLRGKKEEERRGDRRENQRKISRCQTADKTLLQSGCWYQHRDTITHTNTERAVCTFVTSTDVNYHRCL